MAKIGAVGVPRTVVAITAAQWCVLVVVLVHVFVQTVVHGLLDYSLNTDATALFLENLFSDCAPCDGQRERDRRRTFSGRGERGGGVKLKNAETAMNYDGLLLLRCDRK